MFVALAAGKIKGTQDKIVAILNKKRSLDSEGCGGKKKKHILNIRTFWGAVKAGKIRTNTKKREGRRSPVKSSLASLQSTSTWIRPGCTMRLILPPQRQ